MTTLTLDRRRFMNALFVLSAIIVTSLLSGCGARVEPWQREDLSRREMQIPARPVDAFLDDHIYFSKEASRGGSGGGGGGCGCN